jgi:hypothetical protein
MERKPLTIFILINPFKCEWLKVKPRKSVEYGSALRDSAQIIIITLRYDICCYNATKLGEGWGLTINMTNIVANRTCFVAFVYLLMANIRLFRQETVQFNSSSVPQCLQNVDGTTSTLYFTTKIPVSLVA